MNTENDSLILEKKGVRPTANRILVLRAIHALGRPVSLGELTDIMETMDKSSIFRVLGLFVEHHIVHTIEDGSGVLKYEICDGEDECSLDDMHAHFYCEICHRTFCFKATKIPEIELPEGFSANAINYMVKGICPRCSRADKGLSLI